MPAYQSTGSFNTTFPVLVLYLISAKLLAALSALEGLAIHRTGEGGWWYLFSTFWIEGVSKIACLPAPKSRSEFLNDHHCIPYSKLALILQIKKKKKIVLYNDFY